MLPSTTRREHEIDEDGSAYPEFIALVVADVSFQILLAGMHIVIMGCQVCT